MRRLTFTLTWFLYLTGSSHGDLIYLTKLDEILTNTIINKMQVGSQLQCVLRCIIPNFINYDFLDRHLRDLIGSRHVVAGPEKSVTDRFASIRQNGSRPATNIYQIFQI